MGRLQEWVRWIFSGRRGEEEPVEVVEGRPGSGAVAVGNPLEMLEVAHSAAEAARRSGDAERLGKSLEAELTLAWDLLSDEGRTLAILDELEPLARERGWRPVLLRCLGERGSVHYQRGELARALELCEARLALAEELGDEKLAAGARTDIETVRADLAPASGV